MVVAYICFFFLNVLCYFFSSLVDLPLRAVHINTERSIGGGLPGAGGPGGRNVFSIGKVWCFLLGHESFFGTRDARISLDMTEDSFSRASWCGAEKVLDISRWRFVALSFLLVLCT